MNQMQSPGAVAALGASVSDHLGRQVISKLIGSENLRKPTSAHTLFFLDLFAAVGRNRE
jgi:hypothetical protein